MKKTICVILALVLSLSLVACGGSSAAAAKTGFAVIATGAVKGEATADEAGKVQSSSTVAAVLVDEDGKILDCKIDIAETITTYAIDGTVQAADEVEVRTKSERGDDYGMRAASPIAKEWNEQAAAFAAYVIGKTAAEVEAIPQLGADAHNGPDVADLAASCTINVTNLKEAVVAAANNAKALGATAKDKLGMGVVTTVSTADASVDGDGKIQHDSTYAVTTTNAEGKITSNLLDMTQTKYAVTAEGTATCSIEAVASKHELGDNYGMRAASPIAKEWFEQADAFMAYVNGKTAAEVEAIPQAGDHMGPDVADLAASCTINVSGFKAALAKAAA